MKFEVKILGSGSAIPLNGRNCTAQVLNILERYFLVDCGEGTQLQLRKYKVPHNKINNIFISHLHGDHFFGLIGLISTYALQNRRADLHIYAEKRLKDIIQYQINTLSINLGYNIIYHTLTFDESLIYEDKRVEVKAFPLKHRYDMPVWGFRFTEKERERSIIKDMVEAWEIPISFMQYLKKGEDYISPDGKIVPNKMLTKAPPKSRAYGFMTDTVFDKSFSSYVSGVDLLYHEATFGDEFENIAVRTGHSTAKQAANMAEIANADKLLLGHFSARYPNPKILEVEARLSFPNTFAVRDGDVYNIELK